MTDLMEKTDLTLVGSKIAGPYIKASLAGVITEKAREIMDELADEIIKMYDVETIFRSEMDKKYKKGDKLIMTIVLQKKPEYMKMFKKKKVK